MFGLTGATKYKYIPNYRDMRGGYDKLSGVVRSLGENPEDGTAYVFMSKDQKLVKIIHYEDGLLQYYCQKFKGGFSFVRLRFDGDKPIYVLQWKYLVSLMKTPVIKEIPVRELCMVNSDGFDVLFGGMSMRGIILPLYAAERLKTLIFNMLNMLYIFARSNKYDYLCTAKVSYYGRKRTIRYRAHDNACPVCDTDTFTTEAGARVSATYLTFVETCKLMKKTALDFFKGFFGMTSSGRTDYELIVQELLC